MNRLIPAEKCGWGLTVYKTWEKRSKVNSNRSKNLKYLQKDVDVDDYDLMGPLEVLSIDTGIYFSASGGQWE